MLKAHVGLAALARAYDVSRRNLILNNPALINGFYALAPEKLQPYLRHINVFGELMDRGTMDNDHFRVPGVERPELEELFGQLSEGWAGLVEVRTYFPQDHREPCRAFFVLAPPPKLLPL